MSFVRNETGEVERGDPGIVASVYIELHSLYAFRGRWGCEVLFCREEREATMVEYWGGCELGIVADGARRPC